MILLGLLIDYERGFVLLEYTSVDNRTQQNTYNELIILIYFRVHFKQRPSHSATKVVMHEVHAICLIRV